MLLRSTAPRPSSRRLPLATLYRKTHDAAFFWTRRISPSPSWLSPSRDLHLPRGQHVLWHLDSFPSRLSPQNRCVGVHCRDLTGTHRTLRTSDLSCKFKCLVHALAVKCSSGVRGRRHGCARPETWVTERTGHMGNTFRLRAGGVDAVEGVFGDGRA